MPAIIVPPFTKSPFTHSPLIHGGGIKAAAALSAFSFSVTDTTVDASGGTINTFADQLFGDAPTGNDTRYIAVAVGAFQSASRTILEVTIGGVTATEIVSTANNAAPCGVYVAEVPTGTTGSVVVTLDASVIGISIVVCRILNPSSPTGFDTASGVHSSGTVDLSLDIPNGGDAVAIVQSINAGSTIWTGLTELIDTDVDTADFFTAASGGGSPGTPHTVTAVCSDSTPVRYQGHAVSWGPMA
jgi:hypothetical protein